MLAKCVSFLVFFTTVFLVVTYLLQWCFSIWIIVTTFYKSNDEKSEIYDNEWHDLVHIGIDQLKQILFFRGIYHVTYPNSPEFRQQLLQLVTSTGQITRDEALGVLTERQNSITNCDSLDLPLHECQLDMGQLKHFSSANLMEEEMEESTDPVWLLYVRHQNEHCNDHLSNIAQLRRIGFRVAFFDCNSNPTYCTRKQWFRSHLVLLVPNLAYEYKRKLTFTYPLGNQLDMDDILQWLYHHIPSRLLPIEDMDELEDNWLYPNKHDQSQRNLVKMVAMVGQSLRHPPLPLVLLSLRFRHRIHFGVYFASEQQLKQMHINYTSSNDPRLPMYLVSHSNKVFALNAINDKEPQIYQKIEIYLRGLLLDSGDVYYVFFFLLNLSLALNFFWTRCVTLGHRWQLCLVTMLEANLLLLAVVATGGLLLHHTLHLVQALVPHPLLSLVSEQNLTLIRTVWSSQLVSSLRCHFLTAHAYERFLLTFFVTGSLLNVFRQRLVPRYDMLKHMFGEYDDESILRLFHWTATFFSFLNFVLFRNTRRIRRRNAGSASPLQSVNNLEDAAQRRQQESNVEVSEEYEDGASDLEDEYIDLDEDMDRMLVERLFTFPNLWLHTELIPTEYIKDLPLWHYSKVDCNKNLLEDHHSTSSCVTSSTDSSDTEDAHQGNKKNLSLSDDPFDQIEVYPNASSSSQATCLGKSKEFSSEPNCVNGLIEHVFQSKTELSQSAIRSKVRTKRQIIRLRRKASREVLGANGRKCAEHESPPEWMLDLHDCTICLDEYLSGQAIMGLPCGHNYHDECILAWLLRGSHCCPICRWPSYRLKHPRQVGQV